MSATNDVVGDKEDRDSRQIKVSRYWSASDELRAEQMSDQIVAKILDKFGKGPYRTSRKVIKIRGGGTTR